MINLIKRAFVFITGLFVFSLTAFAQKNTGFTIETDTDVNPFVSISLPIDGNFFSNNIVTKKLDENKKVVLDTLLDKAGVVQITFDYQSVYLLARPGDAFTISFKEKERPKIVGNNAAGQELYNRLFKDDTRSRFENLDKYPTAALRLKGCDSLKKNDLAKFQSLLKSKKIDKDFYQLLSNEANMYYKLLFSTNMFFNLKEYIYDPEAAKANPPNSEFLATWENLYKDFNTNPSWIKSKFFMNNILRYISFLELTDKSIPRQSPYAYFCIQLLQSKLSGMALEYTWAEMMSFGLSNNENEKIWLENFALFKEKFPDSKLIKPLEPGIETVRKYQENIENASKEVVFIPQYESINSFDELGEKLKGKVSYVDLWATWCGPCKQELQISIKLHDQIEALGVQPVYVSIDTDEANNKWLEMAKGFPLKGLNIRANNQLAKSIEGKLPDYTGIPRYLIFDKEGKVANLDALRPSDGKLLLEQLEEVTKKSK